MSKNSNKTAFRELLPYLWPNDKGIRTRVVFSIVCLLISKIASLMIPITYKYAVDTVDISQNLVKEGKHSMYLLPYILLAYGGARICTVMFAELRDIVFARVGQRANRNIALRVFKHMHNLSLRFHITRKTGGVSIKRRGSLIKYIYRRLF